MKAYKLTWHEDLAVWSMGTFGTGDYRTARSLSGLVSPKKKIDIDGCDVSGDLIFFEVDGIWYACYDDDFWNYLPNCTDSEYTVIHNLLDVHLYAQHLDDIEFGSD